MLKEDKVASGTAGISPVERLNTLVGADMKTADRLIHKGMASSVELIPDLARHLIESGGKRLRPLLTLAAAKAGGYQGDGHVRLAAAVEPTLGPKGMNAMIDRPIGTPMVTRDGVSIASEIELREGYELELNAALDVCTTEVGMQRGM